MSENRIEEQLNREATDKPTRQPLSEEEKAARVKAAEERRAAKATISGADAGSVATEAEARPEAAVDKPVRQPLSEEEKAARAKLAEERRAARAKAPEAGADSSAAEGEAAASATERPARAPRAAKSEEPEQPKEPSPKQPLLDKLVADLQAAFAPEAIEGAVINEVNNHLPTLTVKSDYWYRVAQWLRDEPEWSCNYLRNLSGVDLETEMEVVYHLIGLTTKNEVAVRVRTNREHPSIDSVTPLWATANWNEREVYDLLGIDFPGHPDLRRIMMSDDWVGHPLRKDYEPLDSEV
ncbi:NADH-quinone oxidoreductase subunit C [Paenibacillus marinisediminis]